MKKIIALVLLLCIALTALVGCGLEEGEKGANVRLYLSDFPQTLDPALVQANPYTNQILSLIFEPLTVLKADGKVAGALAENWYGQYDKVNQEYALYFELNESSWSNSNAVTADDVCWSWKRILSPDTESPYASLLYCIKNAKAVKAGIMTSDDLGVTAEDNTLLKVVFEDAKDFTEEEAKELGISAYVYDDETFEAACDRFAETVSNIHLAPVNEKVVERYKDSQKENDKNHVFQWGDYSAASIIGNGKFKVQAYEPGNKLVLERNSYYRYDEENDVDEYVVPYRLSIYYYEGQVNYSTEETGLTQEQYQQKLYDEKAIHYLAKFSKENYSNYAKKMDVNATVNGYAFLYNTKTITDANVRKALSMAIDRNELVNTITGTGETAATGFVPGGVFNTSRKDDFRKAGGNLYADYTMDNAKALKAKGNYKLIYLIPVDTNLFNSDKRRTIEKSVTFYNVYEDIANYAVARWKELGVNVKAEGLVYADYIKALENGEFDIIGYNVVMDSVDALAYLAPYATMYSGRKVSISLDSNSYTPSYTLLEDKDYDALIDKACYTSNPADRAAALHEAEAKFNELCPATMLFYYNFASVTGSKLSGVGKADYYGFYDFSSVKLSDWRKINAKEEAEESSLEEKFATPAE